MPAEPASWLPMSREEYLAMDREAECKHELWDGMAYAMAGASLAHNRLVRNLLVALTHALAGRNGEALPSDQRVGAPGSVDIATLGVQLPLASIYAGVLE